MNSTGDNIQSYNVAIYFYDILFYARRRGFATTYEIVHDIREIGGRL